VFKGFRRRRRSECCCTAPDRGADRGSCLDVGYHLAVARAGDPGLEAAHEEAVAGKKLRVSADGLARMQELVAMVHETERYPSPRAGTAAERSPGVWLERRRREAAQGTLAAEYREGLGVPWGWQGATRAVSDEARWQDRLGGPGEVPGGPGTTGPGTRRP